MGNISERMISFVSKTNMGGHKVGGIREDEVSDSV